MDYRKLKILLNPASGAFGLVLLSLVLWAFFRIQAPADTTLTVTLTGPTQLTAVEYNQQVTIATVNASASGAPSQDAEGNIIGPTWNWTINYLFKSSWDGDWGSPPDDGSIIGFGDDYDSDANGPKSISADRGNT
jgi:hypothetical protein